MYVASPAVCQRQIEMALFPHDRDDARCVPPVDPTGELRHLRMVDSENTLGYMDAISANIIVRPELYTV